MEGLLQRFQDKVLAGFCLMLIGMISWTYIRDTNRYEQNIGRLEERLDKLTNRMLEMERSQDKANERVIRNSDDIKAVGESIRNLWQRYGELRDGRK